MAQNQRYPNIGKLGLAILESRVKSLIGDDAIKEIKKPYDVKQLQNALVDALANTEKRFIEEYEDKDICNALLQLPISDLPSLHKALYNFYRHPSGSEMRDFLTKQMSEDYPNLKAQQVHYAVFAYLKILKEELVSINDEIRQKLIALTLLGIQEVAQEMAESDKLYKKLLSDSTLSHYIYIKEFQTVVNERTKSFVGRENIIKAIDILVQGSKFPSGYIVVTGEPGIGKTSLIAKLVNTRGYIHHFNIALQNICSVRDFLSNICAQLIIRYELDHRFLPVNATSDSGFLVQLLAEAVKKDHAQRVVILIDALDEASDKGLRLRTNKLFLPATLPEGAYFVITTRERPEGKYHLFVDNREDLYISDIDPDNLEDIRKYIREFILQNNNQLDKTIKIWGVDNLEFIEILTQKSQGNFMYLVYVLQDIKYGRLNIVSLDNIHNLPLGLKEYYQLHWASMRDNNKIRFEKYQKPVIGTLAAIKEPVTVEEISEWTGLEVQDVNGVINEWRAFLNESINDKSERTYRVYHSSFLDFLTNEIGLKHYHQKIVDTAKGKIRWKSPT